MSATLSKASLQAIEDRLTHLLFIKIRYSNLRVIMTVIVECKFFSSVGDVFGLSDDLDSIIGLVSNFELEIS